jgi:hypothetical protein
MENDKMASFNFGFGPFLSNKAMLIAQREGLVEALVAGA